MRNRRHFLQSSAALGGALWSSRLAAWADAPASPANSSFFLVGDTHYCADETDPTTMKAGSLETNHRLIGWLNRLPGTDLPKTVGGGKISVPHGVIHAGDLIDNGDKGARHLAMAETETAAFFSDWGLNGGEGKLKWPVREVHGNHDSPGGDGPVISEIKARNKRRQGLTGVSESGLHYSWDWAGVHFVALGIVVGGAPEISRKRRYAPLGSLPFLVNDLAAHVGTSGRPVVLVHHVDVARYSAKVADDVALKQEWDYGDARAYHAALKPYRAAATLFGHTHARNIGYWDGTENRKITSGIPSINTDNAGHYKDQRQAFLHLEVTNKTLTVREFSTTDAWKTGTWTDQMWKFDLPG